MCHLEIKNFGDHVLNFVIPEVPICSQIKCQNAYWLTNGRTNICNGWFPASTSEAGMEMSPRNHEELCADCWTLQAQISQKLTYPSHATMFQINYTLKHQSRISMIWSRNFHCESQTAITEQTITTSFCTWRYHIKIKICSFWLFILF
jgi:hypothetical protein